MAVTVSLERHRMAPRWTTRAAPLGVAALAAAAVGYVAAVDPNEAGHYPACPLRSFTGLDCPGCGGLRCVHALATGHPVEAADHNLLAVLVLPLFALAWLARVRRSWQGRPRPAPTPAVIVWTFAVAVVAFMVVRNLPGVPFLGSGLG